MGTKKIILLSKIFIGLSLLQLSRIMFKYISFIFIKRTDFSDHMVNAVLMVLFSAAIIAWAGKTNVSLSFFPQVHKMFYIIAAILAIILLASTPIITGNLSFSAVALLIYSSIITPIFEELLFRGLIWNKLKELFKNTLSVYIISTLIFAVWHLGYVDAIMYRMNLYGQAGLANAMFWKVITGLCFGIVLGAVRCKTKNCCSTVLLHGILNMFAR